MTAILQGAISMIPMTTAIDSPVYMMIDTDAVAGRLVRCFTDEEGERAEIRYSDQSVGNVRVCFTKSVFTNWKDCDDYAKTKEQPRRDTPRPNASQAPAIVGGPPKYSRQHAISVAERAGGLQQV